MVHVVEKLSLDESLRFVQRAASCHTASCHTQTISVLLHRAMRYFNISVIVASKHTIQAFTKRRKLTTTKRYL